MSKLHGLSEYDNRLNQLENTFNNCMIKDDTNIILIPNYLEKRMTDLEKKINELELIINDQTKQLLKLKKLIK